VYVCVGTGEGEHEQGGRHEEGTPHHRVQSSLRILAVTSGLGVNFFVDGYEATGEEDTQLDRAKVSHCRFTTTVTHHNANECDAGETFTPTPDFGERDREGKEHQVYMEISKWGRNER
jgi:hypothetical protein